MGTVIRLPPLAAEAAPGTSMPLFSLRAACELLTAPWAAEAHAVTVTVPGDHAEPQDLAHAVALLVREFGVSQRVATHGDAITVRLWRMRAVDDER
jgi:hypothetical protein